ncbi:hypothetical protein A4A49_54885 [Nicotiana attenuata]|uniref:Uncharacterized protein n=1 Tax=Nicotiana attenuata TaxID=49451 RepID=A0A1J6JS92_NICAT|nr:hypothetical protein A4A49_54885 [Nicotiana attenuata]
MDTNIMWKDLNIIGELPNLEVLKLIFYVCKGYVWSPTAEGFTRLKLLLIDVSDLKYWKATNDNFPVLERLVIRVCFNLEEIPIDFADINSLGLIELKSCTPEVEASPARIQQEQEDIGNKPVVVRFASRSGS